MLFNLETSTYSNLSLEQLGFLQFQQKSQTFFVTLLTWSITLPGELGLLVRRICFLQCVCTWNYMRAIGFRGKFGMLINEKISWQTILIWYQIWVVHCFWLIYYIVICFIYLCHKISVVQIWRGRGIQFILINVCISEVFVNYWHADQGQ